MLTITKRPEVETLASSFVSAADGKDSPIDLHTSSGVKKVVITSLTLKQNGIILFSGTCLEDNGSASGVTGIIFSQNTSPPPNNYGWIRYLNSPTLK